MSRICHNCERGHVGLFLRIGSTLYYLEDVNLVNTPDAELACVTCGAYQDATGYYIERFIGERPPEVLAIPAVQATKTKKGPYGEFVTTQVYAEQWKELIEVVELAFGVECTGYDPGIQVVYHQVGKTFNLSVEMAKRLLEIQERLTRAQQTIAVLNKRYLKQYNPRKGK